VYRDLFSHFKNTRYWT